jgi:hypothetical protein
MGLTLRGELGKALDATLRTPALLKIRDLQYRTESVADDEVTWTARTQDLAGGMTILPQAEQQFSLYEDGSRIFHGHVSDPRRVLHGARVTVLGPWWWLRRIQATQAGTAGDRPTMELAEATVKSMLTTVLTRAIAQGAPIRIGTIADTLTIPKQQFSEMTMADVVADLLRYIADGTAWWDYSGSGLPAFNLTRRAGAIDTPYEVGSAGKMIELDVQEAIELVVSRVELAYMTRNSSGVPVQQQQVAGVAATGKTQVVAISGAERDTFVPPDDYESFTVQTVSANVTINTLRPTILNMLPEVIASRAAYSGKPAVTDVILANAEVLQTCSDPSFPSSGATYYSHPQPALQYVDANGAAVSVVGKQLVITPDPPEWVTLANAERVTIKGRIYVLAASTSAKSPYLTADRMESLQPPDWAKAFPWSLQQAMSRSGEPPPAWGQTTSFSQPAGYNRHQNYLWALDFEIAALLTTTAYASPTVLAKPQAFEYLTPPAGMAAALLSMQSFTPWRGRIVRKGAEICDGLSLMNRKFNVTGGDAAMATMGALPKAVTYDFRSKTVSIELGPPSRHDVRTISQRFRFSPQTNITITNS